MPESKQVRPGVWEFREDGMSVPGRIYATEKLFPTIEDGVFRQIANVARLPGILNASMAMPDAHYGYGFPIGGVAAFDLDKGVVSPGGVGYDINCGVRMMATSLTAAGIKPKLTPLMDDLFDSVPSGLGSKSRLRAGESQLKEACLEGAGWAVSEGYGTEDDLRHTEEEGCIEGADTDTISQRAKDRGRPQIGTLGSGNHFLEVQKVDKIYDSAIAKKFGINEEGQITIMIHCGSRGLGYQVADDYISLMLAAARKYHIPLPDSELACAPINSKEAGDYIKAMYCAVNYAFCNRQMIAHWVRETFKSHFPGCEVKQVYDVCHNIAKFEEHEGYGKVCVHRKGATRAFAAGRREIPEAYRAAGQPVIIPGDMGTASYVLVGTKTAMNETFGSVCHGAGRVMSRTKATHSYRGEDVKRKMESEGKVVRADSMKVLSEEAPQAYKDIDEVIKSVELAGLSRPIARLVPMGVAKG
ncbi:MAG: RtcB family protein [Candidatus Altiarchaeota archaeon]|nr:RtcB family protein [Candidatus Altiarchaeota archaeon]